MRILLINNGYPTECNPQITTYIASMRRCLLAAGFEVDLLVIRYHRCLTVVYKAWKYLIFWLRLVFTRMDKYDAIYLNHLPFVWPVLVNHGLRGKDVVIHWHGGDLVSRTPFVRCVLAFIKQRIMCFRHIVPSEYFKRKLIEELGVPEKLIAVSPSGGVDTDLFAPRPTLDSIGRFVIGFSGALTTDKGADVLLGVMEHRAEIERAVGRNLSFKVIDYGREAETYIAAFRRTGADVEVVHRMPKKQMPEFYGSILLLLLSSVRIGESLGLVVLEAMSCGKPVVTFDICAFPEFVRPGISGERARYSNNIEERVQEVINALVKVIRNYSSYTPRRVVEAGYSEQSVVAFYRSYFKKLDVSQER